MAKYITLGRFTERGRQSIRDVPKFRAENRERGKALGVTFDGYLVMGAYDIVWIVEAPSDEAVAKWAVALGATGNVETQTMRAFSEAEMDALLR